MSSTSLEWGGHSPPRQSPPRSSRRRPASAEVERRDRRTPSRTSPACQGATPRVPARATPFMTAASPGVIAMFMDNPPLRRAHDDYLAALAAAMKVEYDEIHRSGPDAADRLPRPGGGSLCSQFPEATPSTNGKTTLPAHHIEVTQRGDPRHPGRGDADASVLGELRRPALSTTSPCATCSPFVYKARPAAISFEAANPRHAHEWEVFAGPPVAGRQDPHPAGVVDSTKPVRRAPRADRAAADPSSRNWSGRSASSPAPTAGSPRSPR